MKKLVGLLALLSTSLFAQDYEYIENIDFKAQGGWASGGGNAVVCFSHGQASDAIKATKENGGAIPDRFIIDITSVEMYDNFEARLPRGLSQTIPQIITIEEGEGLKEWVEKLANRFDFYVPSVSQNIYAGMAAIPDSNIRFYQGAVKQVNDIDNVIGSIDKSRCVVTTMAIQRNFNDYYNLFIDARLFNHRMHSKQSKATLILHEYLYAQARRNNHVNSAATRELVGMAMTRHPDFTVHYGAFLVHNLGFGYGQISTRVGFGLVYVYTALIDAMLFYSAAGLQKFAEYVNETKCEFDGCKEYIDYWNSNILNNPIRADQTIYDIFQKYRGLKRTQTDYHSPVLDLHLQTLLDEYKKQAFSVLNDGVANIITKLEKYDGGVANIKAIKKKLIEKRAYLKIDFSTFFALNNRDWNLQLRNYVHLGVAQIHMDLQEEWLNDTDFIVQLDFSQVIP